MNIRSNPSLLERKTYFTNNFILRLIRFSEAVVVLSEYNKRRVQELGILKGNIYLLRQPLDTDVFAPANEHRRENLRKGLGFSSRKHNILHVGKISTAMIMSSTFSVMAPIDLRLRIGKM